MDLADFLHLSLSHSVHGEGVACIAGGRGTCVAGGVWQWSMHGGGMYGGRGMHEGGVHGGGCMLMGERHGGGAWVVVGSCVKERWPLKLVVRILLEHIFFNFLHNNEIIM